jgi:predicted AlkP superfamily phosphohydrolase/phosphomutase
MTRVLAIGLDAVERAYLDRLVDDGELPELRRLRDHSVVVELVTERTYRSEYPWTEFVTGRSSSALRYWSTVTFDPVAYHCDVVGAARATPFYALGDRRRVIALDVPHSRLSSAVHGAQVIGWGAHDPQFPRCSSPPELLGELEREHGRHPALPIEYAGAWHQRDFLDEFATALLDGLERRVGVVRSLVEQVPDWELMVLAMGEAHTAGHQMWHGVDPRSPLHDAPTAQVAGKHLLAIHRAIDRSIGEIVASVPPDTSVVIFSVKGMEPADVDVVAPVLVPELLHRVTFGRALLRSRTRSLTGDAVVPDPSMLPSSLTRLDFADGRRDRLARQLRSTHPTVMRQMRRMRRLRRRPRVASSPTAGPAPIITDVPVDDIEPVVGSLDWWHSACWYRSYWPQMPAFVIPSFSDLHVRVNLEAREAHGVIPRDGYEGECDRLEALLRACTTARTGAPIFDGITRIRRDDPMAADGPGADLVVECAAPADALAHPDVGVIGPYAYPRVGSHTPNGFAWFSGPGLEQRDLGTHAAIDLPATVLGLLGVRADEMACEGRSMLPTSR